VLALHRSNPRQQRISGMLSCVLKLSRRRIALVRDAQPLETEV